MTSALKKFLRRGAIRIPREKERVIYFYATVVLFVLYMFTHVMGIG